MPTATLIRCGSTSYLPSVVISTISRRCRWPSDGRSRSNHEVNSSIIPKMRGAKKKPVVKKSQPDVKASIRTRQKCSHEGCSNLVIRGGVCVTHGTTRKRCSFNGCTNGVVKGGVCWTHGANLIKKRCSHNGCSNGVVRGGVCVTHGAKREVKRCRHEGCNNGVVKGGV